MLFKNLEKCTEDSLKVELKGEELSVILASLSGATIKGEHAIMFAKIYEKIQKALDKETEQLNAKL